MHAVNATAGATLNALLVHSSENSDNDVRSGIKTPKDCLLLGFSRGSPDTGFE